MRRYNARNCSKSNRAIHNDDSVYAARSTYFLFQVEVVYVLFYVRLPVDDFTCYLTFTGGSKENAKTGLGHILSSTIVDPNEEWLRAISPSPE